MRSPFPGMDPYLEIHWRDVHHGLTTYCRDRLQPSLPSTLRARMEERVYVESDEGVYRRIGPDVRIIERRPSSSQTAMAEPQAGGVAVEAPPNVAAPLILPCGDETRIEAYIRIIDIAAGGRVVTVIEFVSPTNKLPGEGRKSYLAKREECFAAGVNYVEIDLTRTGNRDTDFLPFRLPETHREEYLAWVQRSAPPRAYEIYPLSLRKPLPAIRIPLRESDADVFLELQPLVDLCYQNGAFDDIDYRANPPVPFAPTDAEWADQLLLAAGVR